MPIDIFESFYKQCISDLQTITEAKIRRTVPVVTYDSADEWIKGQILDDDDNMMKTSSALAFLLGSEMRDYVTKTCVAKIRQFFNYGAAEGMLAPNFSGSVKTLFEKSSLFKKYFLKFWQKRTGKKEIDLDQIYAETGEPLKKTIIKFYNNEIGKEYHQAAKNYTRPITLFLNLRIIACNKISLKDPTTNETVYTTDKTVWNVVRNDPDAEFVVKLTDKSDGSFSELINNIKGFAEKEAPEMQLFHPRGRIVNMAAFVQFLKLFGISENKMRQCPGFTVELNADDDMESSKKYLNAPMANTFRPSEDQALAVAEFVKNGDTMGTALGTDAANALRLGAQTIINAWRDAGRTVRNRMQKYFGDYERTKLVEARMVVSLLDSKIESVPDFYNKFSRIVNFISDGSTYSAEDYKIRSSTDDTDVRKVRSDFIDKIKQTKKDVRDALMEHLNPVFSEIIMHSQILYGHRTDAKENDMSVRRFVNPFTKVATNFILPTKNLKAAIEKERYRLSFMRLDETEGVKTLMNTFMRPETLDVDKNSNVSLKPLEDRSFSVAEVMKRLGSLDTKANTNTKSIERQYYVDEESMEKFERSLPDGNVSHKKVAVRRDGKPTEKRQHYLAIGTYINEFHNHNTIVRFVHSTPDAKSVWDDTTLEIQDYRLGFGDMSGKEIPKDEVVRSYVITTPITEMNLFEVMKLIDRNKNVNVYQGGELDEKIKSAFNSDAGTGYTSRENQLRKLFKIALKSFFHELYDSYHGTDETANQSLKDFKDNIDAFCDHFCSPTHLMISVDFSGDLLNDVLPRLEECIKTNINGLFLGMMFWQTQNQGDFAFYEKSPEKKSADTTLEDLKELRADTKKNFILRGMKLTSRALNMAFGGTGSQADSKAGLFDADNVQQALGNILNFVLSYSFIANQYVMSSNFIKKQMSGSGNSTAIKWLDDQIAIAATKAALRGRIDRPTIDVTEIVQSLNSIGEQYIDAIFALKADARLSYDLPLNFTPCTGDFAKILRSIPAQAGGDRNLEYAMKNVTKICYVATYLMFLMFALAKKDADNAEPSEFPVRAELRTSREETKPELPEPSSPGDAPDPLTVVNTGDTYIDF